MAEQDIISIGYDPAFATQNKEVYDQVLQTYNLLKQMDGLKVGTGGAGYADLKAQAAGLQKQIEQLTAANIKLTQAIADGQVAVKQKTKTEKEAEKAVRDESKAVSELANTYKQYSLAARDASIKAKSYALELSAKHPLTIQATKDALEMNTKLKELDATTGIYNRNVGNYSSVLTGYANTLRGLRGPTKLLGEALGIGAQEADQFRIVLEHSIQGIAAFFKAKENKAGAEVADTAATTANTAAQQAQATTTSISTGTTETFTIATIESTAANVAHTISTDVLTTSMDAQILAMRSEIASAEELVLASGGLITVEQARVFVEQELAASIEAVNIATLQGQSVITTNIATQNALTAATTATNIATKALRVTLISLGVLAIAAVIAGIAYAIYQSVKASKEANIAFEALSKTLTDFRKGAEEAIVKVQKVGLAFKEAREGVLTKKEALQRYNNELGDTIGKAKTYEEAESLFIKNAPIYIRAMGLRAQANALFALSAAEAAKSMTAHLQDNTTWWEKATNAYLFQSGLSKKAIDNLIDDQKKNTITAKEEADKRKKIYEDEAIKLMIEADKLGDFDKKDPNKKDPNKKDPTSATTNLQQLKERTNALFQLYKSNQQELIKVNDDAAKNEKNSFEERLTALSDFYYNTDELNRAEKLNAEDNAKSKAAVSILHLQEELKEGKKTAAEKSRINENIKIEQDNLVQDLLVITQKYNKSKTYLDADLSKTTSELIDKEFEKRKKAGHDELEEYKKLQILKNQILKDAASNDIDKQELLLRMQFELDIKKKNAGEIKIIEDKLQKDIDNIHRKGALVQLQLDLNELERKKILLALFGFKIMAIEKQITENQNQQSIIRGQITTQEAHDRLETEQQVYSAMQTFTEDATKTIELIGKLMNITYEKQLNAIQKLIDANNKKQSNELKGIENSTVSEQEKAAMIIQLNARTASKNMELEEEQRQIKIKQAKFDKDAAIAKIILNGAIAFTSALSIPIYGEIQAAIIAGLTAAELAIAIATPIPTYAEGGTHPGGYAIYGEAGLESVKEPGKAPYLVDSPTMGILPAGTVITPLNGMINDSMQNNFMNSFENVMVMAQIDSGLKEIKEAIIEQGWHTQQAIRQQKRGGTNIILNGDFGRYLQKTVIN